MEEIEVDIAGLRDAVEDLRRTQFETTKVSQVLSKSVAETTDLITGLGSTHTTALEVREVLGALRQRGRGDRALLGFILALQFVCLAVVGGLLVLSII